MKLEFIFLGKTRQEYLAAGIDEFSGRLKHFVPIEIRTIKEKKFHNLSDDEIRQEEGRVLLGAVRDGALVVVLDSTGRQISSEELVGLITGWENTGRKNIAFLIGGPVGLAPEVRKRADLVISLSKMTFTHEMARFLLLEQIYRAYTIKAGTGYHK